MIDYDEATLKAFNQIFSKIILAAKYRYATKDDAEECCTFKEQLLKELVKDNRYSDVKIQAAFYFMKKVAIEMLKKGTAVDFIAEVTSLSLEQVETLKKSHISHEN